jgi:hypothetical protein
VCTEQTKTNANAGVRTDRRSRLMRAAYLSARLTVNKNDGRDRGAAGVTGTMFSECAIRTNGTLSKVSERYFWNAIDIYKR